MVEMLNGLINEEDISLLSRSEGLSFDDDRVAILKAMHSIDVQACPGSGKTTLIAAKLMLLAKKWPFSGQGICVLSHTNVAKDEIIERLKRSKTPEAQRLLTYPHFIGTIQEFTGKYLAYPSIRTRKIDIKFVDTDICVELLEAKISPVTKAYVKRHSDYSNVLYDFDLLYQDGALLFKVPTFDKPSTSKSYIDLKLVREGLINQGYFFYRDVFAYARMELIKNDGLSEQVRKRFPLVLIDEMQDTQKFQDELLCQVFPLDRPDVIVQRFGDPDQAIFHSTGSEEPNVSFNEKRADDMSFVVHKSHRFDKSLATKIKPLSVNQIQLSSEISEDNQAGRLQVCSQKDGFQHCVIIFDNDTRDGVIKSFGDIVSQQFLKDYVASERFTVKALGAVGNEVDPEDENQLKIGHYCSNYDKGKAKNTLKATSLIEIVRYAHRETTMDFHQYYKLLLDGIIKWLSLSEKVDENGRTFIDRTLKDFLIVKGKWNLFRRIIHFLLTHDAQINQKKWEKICAKLKDLFEIADTKVAAENYLAYSETSQWEAGFGSADSDNLVYLPDNKLQHPDGFNIQLSTIHGVKGETHDATLIMETKYYKFDVSELLDHLTGNDSSRITQKAMKKFARQLYVAASRPRYLLCIATHSKRITDTQKKDLANLGWKIVTLPFVGELNE